MGDIRGKPNKKELKMLKKKIKQIIANRVEANAYLAKIQSRINRGHKKGATALFNRWITVAQPVQWEIMAFRDKLDVTAGRS